MMDLLRYLLNETAVRASILFDALLLFSLLLLLCEGAWALIGRVTRLRSARPAARAALVLPAAALLFLAPRGASWGLRDASQRIWPRLALSEDAFVTVLSVLSVLWLLVALGLVTRDARRYRRLGRAAQAAPSPPRDPVLDEAMRLSGQHLPCKELPALTGPGVYGLRHPVLLVPCGFRSAYSDRERRMIYLHELAHAKGRHGGPHLLLQLLRRFFFLHAPLRWQAERLLLALELRCDRQAVALCGHREDYAALLLREGKRRAHLPVAPIAFAGRGYQSLRTRLEALLPRDTPRKARQAAFAALSILAVATLLLLPAHPDATTGNYTLILVYDDPAAVDLTDPSLAIIDDTYIEAIQLTVPEDAAAYLDARPGYREAHLSRNIFYWQGLFSGYSSGERMALPTPSDRPPSGPLPTA